MVRVDEETEIPDSGAVFTFGKSKFADNIPSKFWIRNDVVSHLECGDEHTIVITVNGRAYVFGTNDWGQLGVGSTKSVSKPTCLKALKQEKTKCAAAGRSHSLLCTESGKVFAFGANGEGQLGLGDTDDRIEPSLLDGIDGDVRTVAAGSYHSAVLTVDGRLFTFGSNNEGQLGLGDVKGVATPTWVPIDVPITAVSCGYYHTAFVAAGKLYSFGEKEAGKLGLLEKQLQRGTTLPQCIFSITETVASVSCGGNHTAVLTECGKLYVFGSGLNGQLGLGTMVMETGAPSLVGALEGHRVVAVSCGESQMAVVTEQGKLMTCGDGRHGKLGLGNENFSNQFIPVVVKKFDDFFVHEVSCGGCHMVVLATKRQAGDPAVVEIDSERETRLPTTESAEQLEATARGRRRREKELLGSRPLLPPLPTPEGNRHGLATIGDDIARLQSEIDARDKDEEIGETSNGNEDGKSAASPAHELLTADGNETRFAPVEQSAPLVVAESLETNIFQVEGMDCQKDRENSNEMPGNGSQGENGSEGDDDDERREAVGDGTLPQSGDGGGTKKTVDPVESQPKKESFLKKIFNFKKKKSSNKKDRSTAVDEAADGAEGNEIQVEKKSKACETLQGNDSMKEERSKDETNSEVELSNSKKGSAEGSARTEQATAQNATSRTCGIL